MDTTKITLESDRLKLVPLSEKYAEDIFREFTTEITRYLMARSSKTVDETHAYIQKTIENMKNQEELICVITNKKTDEFIGLVGVHNLLSKTPRLGIWIKKSVHGNGFGKEAIQILKHWTDENSDYEYIIYPVDKSNIPSRKIAESLGGVIEAEYKKENMSGNILEEVEYRIYKSK